MLEICKKNVLDLGHFCLKMLATSFSKMYQRIWASFSQKNEGFSDYCEGWVPFFLEIKQKAGWLVGMKLPKCTTVEFECPWTD